MSTIAPPLATIPPADPGWIPSPLYRLTVDQYEAIVASGAFKARDRFHLINGYLVAKMTKNPPHVVADELCGGALLGIIPPGWHLLTANPIRLPGRDSEPEPDRCVVRGTIRDYEDRHPEPADIAMVVEVADSSLTEDRDMAVAVAVPVRKDWLAMPRSRVGQLEVPALAIVRGQIVAIAPVRRLPGAILRRLLTAPSAPLVACSDMPEPLMMRSKLSCSSGTRFPR